VRILFSGTPGHGHLLPLLPLARAFRGQGDDVAFATSGAFAGLFAAEDMALLPVGPTLDVQLGELVARTGTDPTAPVTVDVEAEFFAGVRIDIVLDEALAAARSWKPDLIVSEHYDFVGPFLAVELGVPSAPLAVAPARTAAFDAATAVVADRRYRARGLTPSGPRWYLDTCPPSLQPHDWTAPEHHLPLRPEAHRAPGWRPAGEHAARGSAPAVLVTFGTQFASPAVSGPILRVLAAQGYDVRTTLGPAGSAADFEPFAADVTLVGFTPLAELLRDVDVVVTHGGAGTTLGTLAEGIPLVVVPLGADQFIHAERVAAAGAGVGLPGGPGDPESVAKAVADVLADARFTSGARRIAAEIAAFSSPEEVASTLRARMSGTA
jgi:UDP:flavonoid glycosyltransferase YjiC (YdhE family)